MFGKGGEYCVCLILMTAYFETEQKISTDSNKKNHFCRKHLSKCYFREGEVPV